MSFEVQYTVKARQDLRNIYEYIAYDLLVPETAARQAPRIMKEIEALNEMPMRYRLYDDEPWHRQGVRFFPVDRNRLSKWKAFFFLSNSAGYL